MYGQAQDCVGKSEEQESLKSVPGKMLFPDILRTQGTALMIAGQKEWPTRLLPHCCLAC